jgi:DHA1 family bicyclomycin/chloramphenicol resistance-like MFS transporter
MGVAPGYLLTFGLAVATTATILLLVMTLAGWMKLPVVIPLLVLCNLAFGLIMPNAIERAMQPLPEIAGAAGAAMGCIQMAMGAAASGLVATFYDGHSALSMTALMALFSVLALAAYLGLAAPRDVRRVVLN